MLARSVTTAILALSLIATVAGARSGEDGQGQLIYEQLERHGVLEDYMLAPVGEIAGTIVEAAGVWPGYRINRAHVPGLINIYLIDGRRLPETNILEELEIDLRPGNLRGNAMAHEATGTLFVDTQLLKTLVTASVLLTSAGVDTIRTVATIEAKGLDGFRQVWDPELNPALLSSEYTDEWVLLASGATAFILAHELGHVHVGKDDRSLRYTRVPIRGKEDADIRWACSDLVGEQARRMQEIERRADDYAVALLGKVLFPPGVLTEPMLRYELGAHWYVVLSLSRQAVKALAKTESQNIRSMLAAMVGADVVAELSAASDAPRDGSIQVFFPKTHPANIRRAANSLNRLADSPFSVYHGERPGTADDIARMENLIFQECANLKERQGR
jgi:hypothetical protein